MIVFHVVFFLDAALRSCVGSLLHFIYFLRA